MGYTRHYKVGYTQQYRDEYAEMIRLQAEEAERLRQGNAASRAAYLARLAAEKAEQQAVADAAWEEAHAAERNRLERDWLVAHPDHNASDFITHAWPKLKENLIEREHLEHIEEMKAKMRRTGGYSF